MLFHLIKKYQYDLY